MKTSILKSVVALIALTLSYGVHASVVTCSPSIAGLVGGTSDCQKSTETQDKINPPPMTVNTESFFNYGDWVYAGKHDFPNSPEAGDVNIGFSVTGGEQSGTWSISGYGGYAHIMLIFKSGQEGLVGYLLDGVSTSGNYSSPFPFTNPQGRPRVRDISHITAYVRGSQQVSEPSVLLMLGLGLLALAVRFNKR